MAQAENQNITRRSIALGGIGAAVGAIVPAAAAAVSPLHKASPVIAALGRDCERWLAALIAVSDADDADALTEAANTSLWAAEDNLMYTPAASFADIAIKARTIRAHWKYCANGDDGEFITGLQDHLVLLFDDIEALAKGRAS